MLTFLVERARPVKYAASPALTLDLRVESTEPIRAVLLRCQVRIDAAARTYSPHERERLRDLFGEPERPARGLLWTHATIAVPAFESSVVVGIDLPVSYELTLAVAKYFRAVDGAGDVPLTLLFSGSIFHGQAEMCVLPVPWSEEARFALPVALYEEAIRGHYPEGFPLTLRSDLLARLERFRLTGGHATWDAAVERLLDRVER